jgi:hypothetical protein
MIRALQRAGQLCVVLTVIVAVAAAQYNSTTYNDPGDQAPARSARITQPPVIQYADDAFAVITWSTNKPTESRIFYGTDASNLTLVAESLSQTASTTHRVDLSNLHPNTIYYFQVDLGQPGAISPNQPMLSFRTVASGAQAVHQQPAEQVAGPAESAPVGVRITQGPTIQYADDHSAVISWSTGEGAPTIVYYGTDPQNLDHTAESASGTTFHRVHLSGLAPETTYYFLVDSGQGRGIGPISTLQTVAPGAQAVYNRLPGHYSSGSVEPKLAARRAPAPPPAQGLDIASGTEIHAALDESLSSKRNHPGDEFTAVVNEPVRADNGAVAIPTGTRIRGQVTEAEEGKTLPMVRGRGRLNLHFVDMTLPDGVSVPLQATLASVNDTKTGSEGEVTSSTKGGTVAKDVGIGAGLGTVAGLIFGSALRGLLIGAIAGGGYVLATKGKDVELPRQTGLALRLDHELVIPAAPPSR